MRFIHTSDWHLGRTLHGVSLLEAQAEFLTWLGELVDDGEFDALLVSGDLFDRAIPPIEAVSLLSDALSYLAERTTVIVTSGNHDSAVRLGFAAGAMRDNLHVITRVDDIVKPVPVTGKDGTELLVYALPYLDPDASRFDLSELSGKGAPPLARSHEAVVGRAMDLVREDAVSRGAGSSNGPRITVMGHLFATGGKVSESENDIRVAGIDTVPVDVFCDVPGLDYVALGHLHGAQQVPAPGTDVIVRYAGSPIAYSFSEANQTKSVAAVELGRYGLYEVETFATPVPRRMSEVTCTLDELMRPSMVRKYGDDWLAVTITDPVRPVDLMARIRERFPHALRIEHQRPELDVEPTIQVVTRTQNPVEVFAEFLDHVLGTTPNDAEHGVLENALSELRAKQEGVA